MYQSDLQRYYLLSLTESLISISHSLATPDLYYKFLYISARLTLLYHTSQTAWYRILFHNLSLCSDVLFSLCPKSALSPTSVGDRVVILCIVYLPTENGFTLYTPFFLHTCLCIGRLNLKAMVYAYTKRSIVWQFSAKIVSKVSCKILVSTYLLKNLLSSNQNQQLLSTEELLFK